MTFLPVSVLSVGPKRTFETKIIQRERESSVDTVQLSLYLLESCSVQDGTLFKQKR